MDGQAIKREFFDQLDRVPEIFRLFEHIPDIMFFMKDREGRITAASQSFAVQMGGTGEEDILGKDAFDLCPRELARGYAADDRRVMETGRPLVNWLELNQGPDGDVGWFLTEKVPVYGKGGAVIGIAGVTRNISKSRMLLKPYDEFSAVIEYIRDHLAERIEIPALARLAHRSLNHFERRFKQVFGMPPSRYIVQLRIHTAARLLAGTSRPVSAIAREVGFYDQSALTRYFKRIMGVTPTAFRKQ